MKIQINLRDITFLGFIFCPLKRAEPAENRVEIRQFNIFKPKNPEFKSRKFIEKMKYYYTDIIYKLVKVRAREFRRAGNRISSEEFCRKRSEN